MNRLIKLISVVMIILCFTLGVSASGESELIINYPENHITIQFEDDTAFSEEERQMIADRIAFNTPIIQSRAWCWLTGHDKTTETVTVTQHKALQYDPRCLLEVYLVTTCSKCDYYEQELQNSCYITCCPAD